MKKLATASFLVYPREAEKIIADFLESFPSLLGINPLDVIKAVTCDKGKFPYDYKVDGLMPHQEVALSEIRKALDVASCDGEWPGEIFFEDTSSWCKSWEITLIPYVRDRKMTVHGAVLGTGHGELWYGLSIKIDCSQRPSATAMGKIIKDIESGENVVSVAWELQEYPEKKKSENKSNFFI